MAGLVLLASVTAAPRPSAAQDVVARRDLKDLTLEELVNIEFTSLARKPQRRGEVPAAVTVIRQEDIRRSGARSIPEALRMVPGVHIARVDANKWAVGIRGFTSRLARSQLALMDGRSLYTPLFAGVYWEVQDTFLEDIDRIEVIRGPGGSLWGANAVNGIVNVLTKSAKDTQGLVASAGGGSEERAFGGIRYGGKLGATAYRFYGKYFERDSLFSREIADFDDWRMGRVGFRTDTDLAEGTLLTVQGDLYDGESGQRTTISRFSPPSTEVVRRDADLSGGNLLGRWTRPLGEGSELTVQAYYDRTFRREPSFREERDTFDLELQHRFALPWRQEVQWGVGYRLSSDDTRSVETIEFVPDGRNFQIVSGFVQDEIGLVPSLVTLTIGSKFERNDFSGFEFQPTGRLLWTPTQRQSLWASVSRAVRTPSRVETDLGLSVLLDPEAPVFARVIGDGRFDPEEVLAYEAGYRIEPVAWLFFDLAAFYNRYDRLLSLEPGAPFEEAAPPPRRTVVPFFIRNRIRGDVHGFELSGDARILERWRVRADYSYLQLDLRRRPGSADATTVAQTEGSSPHHQVSLRSLVDLPHDLALDGWVRYVDTLPAQGVGSYVTADARLGWYPLENLELSLVGQNLGQRRHAEFARGTVEVVRGAYGEVVWRW